jgi:hypothetical protein
MLTPQEIIARLEEIEQDLASRQNEYAEAAEAWVRKDREREQKNAEAYMAATGQVTDRKAAASNESATIGMEEEARYVGVRAVVKVLETRATIGQSLLKAHGRI